jgi:diaminopimelate epimerase
MKLNFTKMHGAGNDFILIDDRNAHVPWQDHFLMAAIAARRTGIGCEGIILIQRSDRADFRMRFLNPDGSEAEMCGNGARCAAAFAHSIGASGKALTMETLCGLIDAEVNGNRVCIWMPEPSDKSYALDVPVDGELIHGHFITMGVPHFIVPVSNVSAVDVQGLGRTLRMHPAFAPDGANISFVTFRPPNRLAMRTYERGVEAESGACGTGAVASCVIAVETAKFVLPTTVKTSLGDELIVDGDWRHGKCTGLTLTGPVAFVFTGIINLSAIDLGTEMK